MKVTDLTIKRQPSYEEDAGQLRGIVTLTGPTGQQTIVLSSGGIRAIFDCIRDEVAKTAKQNATLASSAIATAQDELWLLTHEV